MEMRPARPLGGRKQELLFGGTKDMEEAVIRAEMPALGPSRR
jgi:hypothetical protein